VQQFYFNDEISMVHDIRKLISMENYDVILDNSHFKMLSRNYHRDNLPIINFVHDEECPYIPPNCLLGNDHQKQRYTTGKVFKTGIIFDNYNLYENKEDYFCFAGKLEHRKGFDIALSVAEKTGINIKFAGPDVMGVADSLPNWVGEIKDHEKFCEFVGRSQGLFYPSRADAGGMGIWEAAALGTPTITTSASGARCNVIHGKTGYIANNIEELCQSVNEVKKMNPSDVRQQAGQVWDLGSNFSKIYELFKEVAGGKRW
jgi:glycosyltransferase involved in cell wall biosynthesis